MRETLSKSDKIHSISSLYNNDININLRLNTLQPTKSNDLEEDNIQTTLKNLTNIEEGNSNIFSIEKQQSNINLITAVEYNKINIVREILSNNINKKKELDTLNEEGISPLHIAIIKGNLEMVKVLLENGANPNLQSELSNQTPLHFAYLNQNSLTDEIINVLKKYNANEDIYDKNKKKPYDYNSNNYIGNNSNSNNNTITLITMENHFDSFITTNKEGTSNINTNQSQNKNDNNFTENDLNININESNKIQNLNDSLNNDFFINEKENINNNLNENDLNKNNNIKKHKIGESPVIGIKSTDIKFSYSFNEKSNENSKGKTIDDFYKNLIINKRKNILNKYKKIGYHNNSHNNFNKNMKSELNNDSFKNQQRTNTIINLGNNQSLNDNNSNNNITCIHNLINTTYNSTQSQTGKNNKENNNAVNKTKINEFKINDEMNMLNNNNNDDIFQIRNISLMKTPSFNLINKNLGEYTESNCSYLKNWLMNIQLDNYYNNFIDNNIFDILYLVNLMKSYQTKLQYEDIEEMIKVKKPGHIYRILCKLEIDAGLIDEKINNFLLKNLDLKNNKKKDFQISISNEYICNCFCYNNQKKENSVKKKDLKNFLLKNGIMKFYQNFIHNGFDIIEYIILQMYSSYSITDEIIENCFHIYEEKDRKKVLESLNDEMKKINLFICSKDYLDNPNKDKLKYENVLSTNSILNKKNSDGENSKRDCFIF